MIKCDIFTDTFCVIIELRSATDFNRFPCLLTNCDAFILEVPESVFRYNFPWFDSEAPCTVWVGITMLQHQ